MSERAGDGRRPVKGRYKKGVRRWHAWISIFALVFAILVCLTAILLEHLGGWGLGSVGVPSRWFPGYQTTANHLGQIKCALLTSDEEVYIGTRKGLLHLSGGECRSVPQLEGLDIFNIDQQEARILVGTRESTWLFEADQWKRISDFRGAATFAEDGRIVHIQGSHGLFVTADLGATWTELTAVNETMAEAPLPEVVSLSQLVLDLHTGKALFGPEGEWIYVDALSSALLALAITGFIIRPAYVKLSTYRRKTRGESNRSGSQRTKKARP